MSEGNPTPANKKNMMALGIAGLVLVLAAGSGLAIRAGLITPPPAVLNVLPSFLWPQTDGQSGPMGGLFSDLPQTGEAAKMALMFQTGQSGVCTLESKIGDEKVTYSIKGKKFLIEGIGVGEEEMSYGYMLSDGEYQYIWSQGEAQGLKFRLPSDEELSEIERQSAEFALDEDVAFDDSDLLADFEEDEYDISCQFKNLADSLFIPPADVEFLDMSAGFENMFGQFGDENFPADQEDFDWSEFENLMMSEEEIDFSNWQ